MFRITLSAATTSTETNINVDAKMLKVTVDLEGCLPESPFFVRCFKVNHGKLYINVKLINYRIRKFSSSFNRCCLWSCCGCCLNCFCYKGSEPSCTFDYMSASVRLLRLFPLHSFVYSFLCRSFSCYCLWRGHKSLIQIPIEVLECIKTYQEAKPLCL